MVIVFIKMHKHTPGKRITAAAFPSANLLVKDQRHVLHSHGSGLSCKHILRRFGLQGSTGSQIPGELSSVSKATHLLFNRDHLIRWCLTGIPSWRAQSLPRLVFPLCSLCFLYKKITSPYENSIQFMTFSHSRVTWKQKDRKKGKIHSPALRFN